MIRFTREARVLTSLNHSGIAAIYGVEECALVTELVDGRRSPGAPREARSQSGSRSPKRDAMILWV